MIYTTVTGAGVSGSRVIAVSKIGKRSYRDAKIVVLTAMFIDGKLEQTGPYCTVKYEPPPAPGRRFVPEPARNAAHYAHGSRR